MRMFAVVNDFQLSVMFDVLLIAGLAIHHH